MKYTYIKIIRLICVFSCFFFIGYYFDIKKMINNQTPEQYYIKVITCKERSGSSVGIHKNGEYYSIGVSREKCYNYNINDTILLFYNKKYNYFYVPNTLTLYKRYIYASLFMVIITFLPLNKFKTLIFDYLDKKNEEKNRR